MKQKNIYLSKSDHSVIGHLVAGITSKSETVDRLRAELKRAIVLESAEVPDEAIGLGSRVDIKDLDTNEVESYTLTLPAQANFDAGRLSILTPIGAGLLGYELGDEIEWPTPGGIRRIEILNVVR